jgi:tetratricopeptide (TPR) repeat protein
VNGERNNSRWLWTALAATFLAYVGVLGYPFVYDDASQIVLNPRITAWHYFPSYFTSHVWAHITVGIQANYYRPVFMVWMLLTHTFGGFESWAWHLSALLMHLVATFLVYRLAMKLGTNSTIAGMAALFFGLHPIHIESVAWVSGVTDSLLAIFMMLAFLGYLHFIEQREISWDALLATGICLLFALWSKESAIVLPGIIAAHAWIIVDRTLLPRKKIFALIGCVGATTLLYFVLRVNALGGLSNANQNTAWSVALLSVPGVLWLYLRNMLLPFPLSLFYGTSYVHTASASEFWQPLLGILFLLFVFLFVLRKLEAPAKRWSWFGAIALLAPLALPIYTIPFFHDADIVHDRYTYVSTIAFCILLAFGVNALEGFIARMLGKENYNGLISQTALFGLPVPVAMPTLFIALIYFAGTAYQKQQWSSNQTLYSHAVAISQTNSVAYVQLGNEAESQGAHALAVAMYERAYTLNPESPLATVMLATMRHNAGRLQEAEQLLRHAIALDDRNPTVEYRLAQVQMLQDHVQDAESTLRSAIARWPDAPALHYALGMILKSQGKFQEAKTAFLREQQISPDEPSSKAELKALP